MRPELPSSPAQHPCPSGWPLAATLSLLAAVLAGGCGSPPPPPPPPAPTPAPVAETKEAQPASTEAEIGGMNEEATERAFQSIGSTIQGCIEAGTTRVKPLGGSVTIALRVARDGAAKWAYIKASTLGDQETEKCMLDAVRGKAWPKPVGGDGLAEKSFELPAQAEPIAIDEEREKKPIALIRKEAWKCRKGARGAFTATVYVRTSGAVLAASVTPPNEKGEEAADCMAEMIKKVKFVPGGNRIGKLSFEL